MRLYRYLILMTFSPVAFGQTIDHRHVGQVASLPQSVMDAIGKQKWFFTHASLGQNCVLYKGMDALRQGNPARYKLGTEQVEPAFASEPNAPPSPTTEGTIYHWPRGQTDWRGKLDMLDKAVRNKGWKSPAAAIVMDKLCFIDFAANATVYLERIPALERDFPETIFVYVTIPLLRTDREDRPEWRDANVSTNTYNRAVREHCATRGKLLFDIADIESHDPDGKEQTYTHNDQTYQTLYTGYAQGTSNYLNDLGSGRVALGWYALAAEIVAKTQRPTVSGISQPQQGVVEVTWTSGSGANYTVWSCLDLLSGPWNEEAIIPSSGDSTIWTDLNTSLPRKFYRIGVE